MDFVKTLLAYMGIVIAMNVQAAPTPEVTPVPSPTPIQIAADGAVLDPYGQVLDGATPAPTLTPNPAYKNLQVGDKGADVRKLQECLRELGYLSGNVDGAYGYQTRNAVLLFQSYNGLSRDGVAGKATQTRLFQDPNVIPNPETVTPSPEPTSTPDADGLIPVIGNPRTAWVRQEQAKVLYNGEMVQTTKGSVPEVYLRSDGFLVSLDELAEACSWAFSSLNAQSLILEAQEYHVTAMMHTALKSTRSTEDTSYCEAYEVKAEGETAAVEQGDLVFDEGHWYASGRFLEETLHAEVNWDGEENTLVLSVQPRTLAESAD